MAWPVWAADADAFQFFQDEAKVVTASRREQSINEIPMAVDVITPEEIKASGATNLWDLMRFRVGMDVLDGRAVDANRAIVSVRGFPQEFVGNLQVLVDGRSVYEPVSSGVYWEQLPVQLQDIDRIEILRGPNAALYGSGSGLGVINIITKKPQGPTTASLQTSGGNQGMAQTAESFESSAKGLAYRVSYNFRYQDGFPSTSGGTGNDFLRSHKANIRTNWTWAQGSSLELFTGGTWDQAGLQTTPVAHDDFGQHFEMLKFSQKLGDHSAVEVLSSRNDYMDEETPVFPAGTGQTRTLQYDEGILHRLDWWENRMNTVYGMNYRNVSSDSIFLYENANSLREELWSGYLNQTLKPFEKWAVTGGVSLEHSNIGGGGTEPNYQLASLYYLTDNHGVRASYSVAHTIPSLYDTYTNQRASSAILLIGNPDLKPEEITSYEVGYRGCAAEKRLQMDTSLYYTLLKNLPATYTKSATFFPSPLITLGFANLDQAITRGVETEFKYRVSRGRSVYLNYTYEKVSDWQGNTGDVTQNTPAHKVNFGGIADLAYGFSGSVNVGYKDSYFLTSDGRSVSIAAPAYWRLDARLAYVLPWYKDAEVYLAGQNLAASSHQEFADGLTVSRTYQGGVSVKFGGSR